MSHPPEPWSVVVEDLRHACKALDDLVLAGGADADRARLWVKHLSSDLRTLQITAMAHANDQ